MSGRQSSRVTKVPLAKLQRVFKFMESLSRHGEKQEKEEGEVEQEVERSRTKTHVHGWDGSEKTNEIGLESQSEDENTSDDATTDCVQSCSMLQFPASLRASTSLTLSVHNALNVGENVLVVVHNVP